MNRFVRFAPVLALLTAVFIVVFGIGTVVYEERLYAAQKADEATVQARILASIVTAALAFGDEEAAQEYVDALRANPQAEAAAIYDTRGNLFASYARPGSVALPSHLGEAIPSANRGTIVVSALVAQGANTLGTVYIRASVEPFSRRMLRYAAVGSLVIMAALMLATLGSAQFLLSRQYRELQTQIIKREEAEEALRQAQKMEAIGQLTGGVAHDFNNILHVVIGNVEAMRRRVGPGGVVDAERFTKLADGALTAADRAAMLTRQLLAFARRQPLSPKPLDVNKLVAGMSDLLRRTLGEAIIVETVLAGGLWRVSADPNQLESALLNLAVNARDAMQSGGKLTIETGNSYIDDAYAAKQQDVAPGQYVTVAVSDTGSGMTGEVIARAFDPFFTTKEVGRGTGLGLSQVYGFVKQSGGHVRIYSELGEGSTVRLYLPRLVGESADAEDQAPAPSVKGGLEPVLLVEDNEDVRERTASMLAELGYSVIEAPDGAVALRLLEAHPEIKLLFTDVGLPGMNGRELAGEAQRLRPGLPVLFTTGYARNAIVHNGTLDPGVELLVKPFTLAALAIKIRQLLDTADQSARAK